MTARTAKTERTCVVCGKTFSYKTKPGPPYLTCSDACAKKRRNEQIAAWRRRQTCPPDKHGTLTGSVNYGCDCDRCRAKYNEYRREKRAEKKGVADGPAHKGA